MNSIEEIISNEEKNLMDAKDASHKLNILHNLIVLKNEQKIVSENYQNIKQLIDLNIETIKSERYGYDAFNFGKFDEVLGYLNFQEQISVLKYALSTITRELPEHDNEWILSKKNRVEISNIFDQKKIYLYPKAVLLYAGASTKTLFLILFAFIILIYIVLLPSTFPAIALYNITYQPYSNNFHINHLLNILTLFTDLDNGIKIEALNTLGIVLIMFAKVIFVVFIANYVYRKLSDKISLK